MLDLLRDILGKKLIPRLPPAVGSTIRAKKVEFGLIGVPDLPPEKSVLLTHGRSPSKALGYVEIG
jgi:hypothetical protein